MNLDTIKNVVTSKAGRQILTLQKHSPKILFGAGIVGVVATAVLASKATMNLESILYDHKKDMDSVDEAVNHRGLPDDEGTKAKALVFTKTTTRIMKLYGPAVGVGALSIAALTGSHHIMSQRNAGLMAAYSAIEKGFSKYRERVQADLGVDKDREYMYGSESREYVKAGKNGSEKTVVEVKVDPEGPSIYAKLFGKDTSQSWSEEPAYNVMFLKGHQNFLNDKLKARGHVFLNEAYDALGLDRTKEGSVVGWVWDADGDGYVDFGVFNRSMEPEQFDFFTGQNNAIWLDFNVDGVIYDKI